MNQVHFQDNIVVKSKEICGKSYREEIIATCQECAELIETEGRRKG